MTYESKFGIDDKVTFRTGKTFTVGYIKEVTFSKKNIRYLILTPHNNKHMTISEINLAKI